MAYIFITLAGLIHLYIFIMESLLWGKPKTNRTFGLSAEQAEQNRLFAFNQGFYNLFLAFAVFTGMALVFNAQPVIGTTLMVYAAGSMLAAAIVLICSQRKLIRPALIQGLPPAIGLLLMLF